MATNDEQNIDIDDDAKNAPMIPHGKHLSMRIFPSTFTTRCCKIDVTSLYVSAYFNRLRKIKHKGKHSRCLCGPIRARNESKRTHAFVSTIEPPTRDLNSLARSVASLLHHSIARERAIAQALRHHRLLFPRASSRNAPGDGFGANTPPSLSSIQCFGAFNRFKCFFGPRGIASVSSAARTPGRRTSRATTTPRDVGRRSRGGKTFMVLRGVGGRAGSLVSRGVGG